MFEFETHVGRTADSARLMIAADAAASAEAGAAAAADAPELAAAVNAAQLRTGLARSIRLAISTFDQLYSSGGSTATPELKVTVLSVWGDAVPAAIDAATPLLVAAAAPAASAAPAGEALRVDVGAGVQSVRDAGGVSFARHVAESGAAAALHGAAMPTLLLTHVTPLPARRAPPVKVVIRGAPRHNAAAKDSAWVKQRSALEATKPPDVEEVLLATPQGEVLEGTQTNFGAIIGGVVYTAHEGVLAGTVRRLLLEVCAEEEVPVSLEPPRVSHIGAWEAAFLTSTSRLLLPIDEVAWPSTTDVPHAAADAAAAAAVAASEGEGKAAGKAAVPLPPPDHSRSLGSATHPLIQRLQQRISEEVARHSTDVFAVAAAADK